jgi:ATP-dependent exoDNAse (exonuclease V) beta subunit
VIHLFLQRIAREGLHNWSAAAVTQSRAATHAALVLEGVAAEADLQSAAAEVEKALINTLEDERGRWCLAAHGEAETELSLAGIVRGAVQHVRIDRTFVVDGVRWLIDYKTGTRQGGRREEFLDNEVLRYKEQMESYAELVSRVDSRPIKIGLYFPLERGWRELSWHSQPQHPLINSAVAP